MQTRQVRKGHEITLSRRVVIIKDHQALGTWKLHTNIVRIITILRPYKPNTRYFRSIILIFAGRDLTCEYTRRQRCRAL